jgi:hypothetical protein
MERLYILIEGSMPIKFSHSIEELESYLEPIDAKSDDCKVFDSDGFSYRITVSEIKDKYFFGLCDGSYEMVTITPEQAKTSYINELDQLMREFFETLEIPENEWQSLTTKELIIKCFERQGRRYD